MVAMGVQPVWAGWLMLHTKLAATSVLSDFEQELMKAFSDISDLRSANGDQTEKLKGVEAMLGRHAESLAAASSETAPQGERIAYLERIIGRLLQDIRQEAAS